MAEQLAAVRSLDVGRPPLLAEKAPEQPAAAFDGVDGPRHTEAVEVKWGFHPAGEKRQSWVTEERRTTLAFAHQRRFTVELSTGTVQVEHQGDYLVWGPGIDHTWFAEEDSVVPMSSSHSPASSVHRRSKSRQNPFCAF